MSSSSAVDIVIVGHFAKDELIVDGVGEIASGGSVYYGSVALRRLGFRVAVVTRLHPEDFPRLEEIRREGVQIYATPAAETSGIANFYDSNDMERRICKPIGFAGPFSVDEIPDLAADIHLVGPIIAGEVDLALLELLAKRGRVALDVQGFVRVRQGEDLVFRHWEDIDVGLSHVHYLKADRAEAELLTGEADLRTAARRLASYGPREIVITQSSGVTVHANGNLFQAPFTPRSLAGRTGRGDTCFATYLGKRLSSPPGEACRFAAAVTTLKQERPGPWRGTLTDVEALLADWDSETTAC